jgi:hypothetical protein
MNKSRLIDIIGIIVIFLIATVAFRGDNFEIYKFCAGTISTWILFILGKNYAQKVVSKFDNKPSERPQQTHFCRSFIENDDGARTSRECPYYTACHSPFVEDCGDFDHLNEIQNSYVRTFIKDIFEKVASIDDVHLGDDIRDVKRCFLRKWTMAANLMSGAYLSYNKHTERYKGFVPDINTDCGDAKDS